MYDIKDISVHANVSIKYILNLLTQTSNKIILITDENNKLLGTINDGDIRRGLLKGYSITDSIENIYCSSPIVAHANDSKNVINNIAKMNRVFQIPIINDDGVVIGLDRLDKQNTGLKKTNKVILMVGGLGSRLRPLTESTPKPMLKVGNKPILHTIIQNFALHGFVEITMCVNYKSEIVQEYFGNGHAFGVNIEYIVEKKRMGTAGALSLLNDKPKEAFFVMNGDLLTNVNFEHLLDYHISSKSVATMCVREYDFQVPYGVVHIEDSKVQSIIEKPVNKFFVNAGIYMFNSEVIDSIPENKFFDMPTLFEQLIEKQKNVVSFPIREYWIDIGKLDEYEKANQEYKEIFI